MREILNLDKIVYVTSHDRRESSTSSKGNQVKWFKNNKWIKADGLGYEGLSEAVASKLLSISNIEDFVEYKTVKILETDTNKEYRGCISDNFLKEDEELISLYRLFTSYGINLDLALSKLSIEEKINYVIDNVEQFTGLKDFKKWLGLLLEFDYLILNEDRHFHNIGVIYSKDGFRLMPIFDCGAGFLSDTSIDYSLEGSIATYMRLVNSKPFTPKFEKQMKAIYKICGSNIKMGEFGEYVDDIYTDEEVIRVNQIVKRMYRRLFGEQYIGR